MSRLCRYISLPLCCLLLLSACSRTERCDDQPDESYAVFIYSVKNVPYLSEKFTVGIAWSGTDWEIETEAGNDLIADIAIKSGGDVSDLNRYAEVECVSSDNHTGEARRQDLFIRNNATGEKAKISVLQDANEVEAIHVSTNMKYQTVDGIGGGIANYEAWYVKHPNKSQFFDLIFKDLEISIMRLGNWYAKDADDNPILAYQKEIVDNARNCLGSDFTIMLSNWLLPSDLIDRPGESGATLKKENGEFIYSAFADWCRESLEAYQGIGISPDYLSMMNEPDGTNSNGNKVCLGYDPNDANKASYNKALLALHEALEGVADCPKLIGPEVMGLAYNTFNNYYNSISARLLDVAAFHTYHGGNTAQYVGGDRYASADAFIGAFQDASNLVTNMPIMMTENCSYHPAVAEDAVYIAHFIANSFVYANVTAYIHWALLWGYANQEELAQGGDGCIAVEFPWSTATWSDPAKGYVVRGEYYGLKHFTKHVKPGWKRVEADCGISDVRAVAFESPTQNQVTVVLINYGQDDQTTRLQISGYEQKNCRVYQSDTQNDRWYEECEGVNPLALLRLPKMSVTTIVLE